MKDGQGPASGAVPRFTAVVLAGERAGASPVAQAAGVCCKALAPVSGRPMVARVLDTLVASEYIEERILCGLPAPALDLLPGIREDLDRGRLTTHPGASSPSASLAAVFQGLSDREPVLVTTADHALLTPEMVDFFGREAVATGADLVVALAPADGVMAAIPGVRRTVIRFRDRGYCGCNLFAFLTPGARVAAQRWRRVEQQRKRPWRVIGLLGWASVLQYLAGRLSLQQALDRLSIRLGLRIAAVLMPQPEAAVDVDTPDDWRLANQLVVR